MNRVLRNQLAGDVFNLAALSFALQALFLPPDSSTQLQTVQFPYLDTWKVFKECGEVGMGGYSPGLFILHDPANGTCLHYSDSAGS